MSPSSFRPISVGFSSNFIKTDFALLGDETSISRKLRRIFGRLKSTYRGSNRKVSPGLSLKSDDLNSCNVIIVVFSFRTLMATGFAKLRFSRTVFGWVDHLAAARTLGK